MEPGCVEVAVVVQELVEGAALVLPAGVERQGFVVGVDEEPDADVVDGATFMCGLDGPLGEFGTVLAGDRDGGDVECLAEVVAFLAFHGDSGNLLPGLVQSSITWYCHQDRFKLVLLGFTAVVHVSGWFSAPSIICPGLDSTKTCPVRPFYGVFHTTSGPRRVT